MINPEANELLASYQPLDHLQVPAMPALFEARASPPLCEGKLQLNEAAAVDIWIARWLRIPRIAILRRYDCDPRRLYEIWEGKRFPESRERALAIFTERYPHLVDRTDFGNHRPIPRSNNHPAQLKLFE